MKTLKDLIIARLTERQIPGDTIGGRTPLGVTIEILSEHFERLMVGRCLHEPVQGDGESYVSCKHCHLPIPNHPRPIFGSESEDLAIAAGERALEALEQTQKHIDSLNEHTKKLDANWETLHNASLDSIRLALGLPEASVPEMVAAILGARSEHEYQLHEAWWAGHGHEDRYNPTNPYPKRPDPPQLFVFTDEIYFVIAHSSAEATHIVAAEDLGDDWVPRRQLPSDEKLTALIWKAGTPEAGKLAPFEESEHLTESLTLTAAEWIARYGRGFLYLLDT